MHLTPLAAGLPPAHVPDRTDKANAHLAIGLAALLFLGIVGVVCASLLA